MSPIVSIIVPVYNVEEYLDRCLASLMKQTLTDIEIILVDDGSKDKCPEMCDMYAEKDSRIHVVHKENAGLGFARNTGIDHASGEYIAFADPDDYVAEDMYEKLVSTSKRLGADAVYGALCHDVNGDLSEPHGVKEETVWRGEEIQKLLLDIVATMPKEKSDTIIEVSTCCAVFKRSVFEDNSVRFHSEREFISEDLIFDIDFLPCCSCIAAIPDVVYFYWRNMNSLSKSFRADRFKRNVEMYLEVRRRLSLIFDESDYALRMDRFLIARARVDARALLHYRNKIGDKKTNRLLREICTEPELTKVLRRYPIHRLPIKYRLVCVLMKYKMYPLLKLVLKH